MRQTGKERNIRSLIGFELFMKTACLSFFVPGFGMLFEVCLRASGYSYVTKENLPEFVLSPCVLLLACVVLLVFSFLVITEANAVCLTVKSGLEGKHITFSELFYRSIEETRALFRKKMQGVKVTVCCLLFLLWGNLPNLFFLFWGLGQTGSTSEKTLGRFGIVLLVYVIVCLIGLYVSGRKYLFRGVIKRGIILYAAEGIAYIGGLLCLLTIVIGTTDGPFLGGLLWRTFERYHLFINIVFVSVNTVVFEYFCAKMLLRSGKQSNSNRKTDEGKERKRRVWLRFACIVILTMTMVQIISFFRNGTVLLNEALNEFCITAHRGASEDAPENTMAAVELAVEQGADYAEIDVRLTADGVPVLLHDAALFRTTGILNDVDRVTYDEVSSYDAGSSYSRAYAGEPVPGLRDVLEEYGGRIGFNIELKTKYDKQLAEAVVALIEEFGLEESCVITSASYQQLEWVKELNPGLKTGYILSMVYGDFYECGAADFFSIRSSFVTETVLKKAHAIGKEVHVWTVNKEYELKRMKAIGVDNIITDKPAYARTIVYENPLASSLEEWLILFMAKK